MKFRLLALMLVAVPAAANVFRSGVVYSFRHERPDAIVVADFNGDGRNDVAAGDRSCFGTCDLMLFLQKSDGTLAAPVTYPHRGHTWVSAIAAGDFNHDGRLDIALTVGRVLVMPQQPDGTFSIVQELESPRGAIDIESADVNGDGLMDLAAMPWGASTMDIFEQQPGGGFVRKEYPIGGYGYDDFELADLNGDGRVDALNASGQGQWGHLHLNYATPTGFGDVVQLVLPWQTTFESIETGDFNGDLRADLAVVTDESSTGAAFIGLVLQQPDGTFAVGPALPAYRTPHALLARDLDGDGDSDLAVTGGMAILQGRYRYVVQVYLQTTPGVFAEQLYALPDAQSNHSTYEHLAVGDVNGDGVLDLVVAMDRGHLVVFAGGGAARRRAVRSR